MGSPSAPQDHKKKTDPRAKQRLTIGGKSRLLRFDGNAIIEVCDETGFDDLEQVIVAAASLNTKMIRALVWAGCLHDDDEVQLQDVGAWMGDGRGLTSLSDCLVACIAAVEAAIGISAEDIEAATNAAAGVRPTRRGGTGTRPSAPRSTPASPTSSSGD